MESQAAWYRSTNAFAYCFCFSVIVLPLFYILPNAIAILFLCCNPVLYIIIAAQSFAKHEIALDVLFRRFQNAFDHWNDAEILEQMRQYIEYIQNVDWMGFSKKYQRVLERLSGTFNKRLEYEVENACYALQHSQPRYAKASLLELQDLALDYSERVKQCWNRVFQAMSRPVMSRGKKNNAEHLRALGHLVDTASSSDNVEALDALFGVFLKARQGCAEQLKDRLSAVEAAIIQQGKRAITRDALAEIITIKDIAGSLGIVQIEMETSNWLNNYHLIELTIDYLKEYGTISVQDLQALLSMDKSGLTSFLIQWAGPLGLKIENDLVHFESGDLTGTLRQLEDAFAVWANSGGSKNAKL